MLWRRNNPLAESSPPPTSASSVPPFGYKYPFRLWKDLVFDVLFYVFGGIFSSDEAVIYYFLDWGRAPGQAITVVAFLLFVALPLVHGVNMLIARARERVGRMRPDWGWQVGERLIFVLWGFPIN